ncbi:MAG: FkbM family methyltransferase [Proteobacteria bacterium]|nr:FkbM family methyltransferase [Pseudomonadota bacterium]
MFFEAFGPAERHRIAEYGDERPFLEYFLSRLNPDDIVFDIGASLGLFSLHAAARLERGVVYAFEPDPETRSRLRHNHALNPQLDHCCFVEWAVSDQQGETILYSEGAAGRAPSLKPLLAHAQATCRGEVRVKTKRLDDAIAEGELPSPDVLKIDIEGAEILCLRGAEKMLRGIGKKRPRLLFLETHPDYLPEFGSDTAEVFDLLATAGFAPVWQMERFNQCLCCFERLVPSA